MNTGQALLGLVETKKQVERRKKTDIERRRRNAEREKLKEKHEEIVRLYLSGKSIYTIGRLVDMNRDQVRRVLENRGVWNCQGYMAEEAPEVETINGVRYVRADVCGEHG